MKNCDRYKANIPGIFQPRVHPHSPYRLIKQYPRNILSEVESNTTRITDLEEQEQELGKSSSVYFEHLAEGQLSIVTIVSVSNVSLTIQC